MCKYRKIADICNLHGVYLIEDAAESLGATYKGKHTGTLEILEYIVLMEIKF